MKSNATSVSVSSLSKRQQVLSLGIIVSLFFVFGFVTWINAILIPYFKGAFELNHFDSYLVAFAFYIAYLVMAIPSGYLLRSVGFKKGIMIGFFIMALGAAFFIPAGIMQSYPLFLLGLFTLGIGLAVLQTAANPYVTILGDKERAAQRFSIMGISNKLAGILAPLLFAAIVLRPEDQSTLDSLAQLTPLEKELAIEGLLRRVVLPYAVVSGILLLLGLLVKFSPLPEIHTEGEHDKGAESAIDTEGKTSILHFPHLVLGSIAIFFHVGSQVIAVDSIIGYAQHTGLSFSEAKSFPSYTLTATIVGYLLGIVMVPRFLSQLTALRVCTILGFLLSMAILLFSGEHTLFGYQTDISVWFLVLLGFANSMIWAGVWPLAMSGLGRFLKIGASLLVMALCGNAIMPMLYGYFADTMGIKDAYLVLLPCYAYLIYYSFHGFNVKRWRR
ncbi:sugar MFS transporter [Sphingobacterium sp. MYb382]|uniref:sugar MFS transporter n=1 Tax=Sphingobacterium sp. MYb382 TaxID=2745278 RepID=UPI0030A74E46